MAEIECRVLRWRRQVKANRRDDGVTSFHDVGVPPFIEHKSRDKEILISLYSQGAMRLTAVCTDHGAEKGSVDGAEIGRHRCEVLLDVFCV